MKWILIFLALTLSSPGARSAALEPPLENLTLDQAIAWAEAQHPDLAEARALTEAATNRAQQAGRFPNPELVGRVESVPLQRRPQDTEEYLGGVSQSIPLSRRLSKAREAERLEAERLAHQHEVQRRRLRKRVHSAFATALYQERATRTLDELLADATRAAQLVQARVAAGDAIPEDAARAELESQRLRAETERSQSMRAQARTALAGAMGRPDLPILSLAGELEQAFELPALETLASRVELHPGIAGARAEVAAREARVALARAEQVPDIKVETLYRRVQGGHTIDVGFNLPLPVFDQRQGQVRAARAELEAAQARSRSVQVELQERLQLAQLSLSAALRHARSFKEEIVPRAATVLKAAEARHQAGEAGLADLLQVRRDWGAVQLSYLESLREVMQAWGELQPFLKDH